MTENCTLWNIFLDIKTTDNSLLSFFLLSQIKQNRLSIWILVFKIIEYKLFDLVHLLLESDGGSKN